VRPRGAHDSGAWQALARRLYAAVAKVAACRGAERAKVAARFLQDFSHYHRDLRRLEILNAALDSVKPCRHDKLRELSRMNGTLLRISSAEEQPDSPRKYASCATWSLKADVRDSTRLTRTLMEKGLNPASYFSLNFYDPVNKLLASTSAKSFLEGDAIILAILEREGEPGLAVSRACVLARESFEIVRGYNELMKRSNMPELELGIGITLQEDRPALSHGRRTPDHDLPKPSTRAIVFPPATSAHAKLWNRKAGPFHVYVFPGAGRRLALRPRESADQPNEDSVVSYNLGRHPHEPIRLPQTRAGNFPRPLAVKLPPALASDKGEYRLSSGIVPSTATSSAKSSSRKPRPQSQRGRLLRPGWTDRTYYEICTDPAIYAALEKKKSAKA